MKNIHHPLYHTTAVYRGKSYVTCECVTGKLFFLRTSENEKNTALPHGAVIAVITSYTETTYMTADDSAFSAVAAIFVGERPSEALCTYVSHQGIPFLILGRLSEEHNERVAILDSRTGTLFVDPDLDTLTRYARALRLPHGLSFSPILLSCSRAMPLIPSPHALFCQATLLSADTLARTAEAEEESLFEALCELAEERIGASWILPLRVYDLHAKGRAEWLRERLRALLRAGVFAPFSLLFEGLFCADEVRRVLQIWEEVCQELAAEGREYDRHLPIGIAIESLLLLHELRCCPHVDYACLDWDRLLRSTLPPFAGKAPAIENQAAFCALLNEYTATLSLPLCARTVHLPITEEWPIERMPDLGIQALFVPTEDVSTWEKFPTRVRERRLESS